MGTPAVMHGVCTSGMADSQLRRSRNAIACAAAPSGSGKNPELVLYVSDCHTGTLDPAFDAHGQPIAFWSYAWWQKWRPVRTLIEAANAAQRRFVPGHANTWKRTVGPMLALLASCHRIGWKL
eukprot:1915008-Karenia_brevis.AAC.1